MVNLRKKVRMSNNIEIFSESWRGDKNIPRCSWKKDVLKDLNTTGAIYISTLRQLFKKYPFKDTKQKKLMHKRLENTENYVHLGAVNELTTWAYLLHEGYKVTPLPASNKPSPDFKVDSPSEFFVEVTTVNQSKIDQKAYANNESVPLNHENFLKQFTNKLSDSEKINQIKHADNCKKPGVLFIYDYTTWSGFGIDNFTFLNKQFINSTISLPVELSAIVYLIRKVLEGRIALSRNYSGVYINPTATFKLPAEPFPSLNQFIQNIQSAKDSHWLYLDDLINLNHI